MTHCKRLFINGQFVEVMFVPDEADPRKASLRQTWAVEGGEVSVVTRGLPNEAAVLDNIATPDFVSQGMARAEGVG